MPALIRMCVALGQTMIVTLGVEDELQVVDARTGALAPHDIERTRRSLADGPEAISCEIHKCAVEIKTPVCTHPDVAVAALSSLRSSVAEAAAQQGQLVLAAGLHPFSHWQDQPVHEDAAHPHYVHLIGQYGDIARSAMSFGLHIHLGLPDPKLRMPVMNGLRSVLPEILALSVNAPFHEGRDTGLQSWRHSMLGRYPRMGIPDPWPSEEAYFAHIEKLRRLGSIEPGQGMWDDLRLHHRLGTLEVRICDAIHSLKRVWLIVALLQCEAAYLAEAAERGELGEPEPCVWIEENKWRARRHGMRARLVDWRTGETATAPQRYERWLDRLRPAAAKLGLWPRIEGALAIALSEGTGAEQQRAWYREGDSFEYLVSSLVDATATPWTTPAIRRPQRDIPKSTRVVLPVREPWAASSALVRTGRPAS